jgi:hypothetical protein
MCGFGAFTSDKRPARHLARVAPVSQSQAQRNSFTNRQTSRQGLRFSTPAATNDRSQNDPADSSSVCPKTYYTLRLRRWREPLNSNCKSEMPRCAAYAGCKDHPAETEHRASSEAAMTKKQAAMFGACAVLLPHQASSSWRTRGPFSGPISRLSSPWKGNDSRLGSRPNRCRIVACKSCTPTLSRVMK